MNNDVKNVLMSVALGDTYETEYAGRTYIQCTHCGYDNDDGEKHDSDCLMIQARDALGEEWTNYLLEQEREKQELREQKSKDYKRDLNRRTCRKCKTVFDSASASRQHMDTKRCQRLQKKLETAECC